MAFGTSFACILHRTKGIVESYRSWGSAMVLQMPASSLPRILLPGSPCWRALTRRALKGSIVLLTLAVVCLSTVSRGGELTSCASFRYLSRASRMEISRKHADVQYGHQVSRTPPPLEEPVKVADSFAAPKEESVPPYKAPVIPVDSLRSPPAGF